MSKLPTLLVPGSLRLAAGEPPAGETPISYITAWLRRRMPEYGGRDASLANRVLVVRAETGSGKSTVLPVAVFRILRSEKTQARQRYRGPGVICTQPRVLTAIALAADVAADHSPWNPDMVLGETVGYQTGPVSNRPPAGLVFATAGVLAAQLRQREDGEIMERYRFVIVDEAHERSLDSDMTLMLLRNFYLRNAGNERLPFLVLASATFDPERYAGYFGVGPENVVEVVGRSYPIETHWPAQGTNDYPAAAAELAVRIHEAHPDDPPERADILIFMPGAAESQAVYEALAKANRKYTARGAPQGAAPQGAAPLGELGPMLVLVINREVVVSQTGDYALVFEKPGRLPAVGGRRPARRVVISTVVAETGLTIDTLRHVIDCGWNRTREVYQPWGVEGIVSRPAPRSRIKQRAGRVGRLFPGDFWPLYTENVHAALPPQQLPDIISTGPAEILLALVREQQRQKLRTGAAPEFRVEDITALDPPPPEAYLAAAAAATALGFLAPRAPLPDRWPVDPLALGAAAPPLAAARGYGLTPLGHIGASFARTPMEGVRVLLAGYTWGAAASDLLTAVAMFGTALDALYAPAERRGKGALPPGARALRAALPPYLVQRAGGGAAGGAAAHAALPPSESEAFYFRARLLIADDFAEAVLIFDAFALRLDASQGDVGAVAAWCEEVGLNFEALVDVARRRETALEEMVVAGLNPFRAPERRLAALPADGFTDGLRRLKRCLYDGLRARLLRYAGDHPEGPGYFTAQGLRVRTPDFLSDAMADRLRALRVTHSAAPAVWRPRWVLTEVVRLLPAKQRPEDRAPPLLYAAETSLVSVLDGYVDPDLDFDGPRAFSS